MAQDNNQQQEPQVQAQQQTSAVQRPIANIDGQSDGFMQRLGVSTARPAELRLAGVKDAGSGQRAVYDAIDRRLSQLPQISEADVETARQRHKRNAMIGALGDGLRALSNLYFTTQGAPSSYVPSGVPEREQERYQRIVTARQAADDERLRLTMLADNLRRQDAAAAARAGDAELDRQYKWARVQQISQRIETDRMNLQLAGERLQQLIAKGASEQEINAARVAQYQAQTALANSRAALVGVQTQYYPSLAQARIGAANRSNRGRTSQRSIQYNEGLPVSETTTVTVDGVDEDLVAPVYQGGNTIPAKQQ